MKKLCFDAGHVKNYNQGKVKSYYEGNVMWDLHLLVKDYLEKNYDVEIITTRSNINTDLGVYDRGLKAKGCEGFYSFHSNYDDNSKLERVVIIRGLNLTSLDSYSTTLGDTIKDVMNITEKTQVWERSYNGNEYYGVLRGAKAVGVTNRFIIEHSWHSNERICNWLLNKDNLNKLAVAEAESIAKYHKLVKKSNNTTFKKYYAKCITNVLNCRTGAGMNYKIENTITKDTVITIIDEKVVNGVKWLKGLSGYWVSSEYMQFVRYV